MPSHSNAAQGDRPPLEDILNTYDFERAASQILTEKAWAFFSSAATDCVTKEANEQLFRRIWLRPRILKNVRDANTETKMLGMPVGLPLFVSPAAMAKLAHPDGEIAIAKACSKFGIAQTVSTNASYPLADITATADIPFFFQLYVNKDRSASEELLRNAEKCGAKAVFVTVDQPTPGKREADERAKSDAVSSQGAANTVTAASDKRGNGLSRLMGGFIDSSFNWQDIKWLRQATRLPIVLKGVLSPEDAMLAVEHGLDGIIVGNHGGRSLDTSTPSILALLEMQQKFPAVFKHLDVYFDGGIRRGTDIFKALCLGAKAVGMGRHFLYAATYGTEGVEHLLEIMKDEFETTMRMMGCTDLSQLHPGLLNLRDVENLIPRSTDSQQLLWAPQARL